MKEENEIFKAGFQAGLRDGKPGTPPILSDPAGEDKKAIQWEYLLRTCIYATLLGVKESDGHSMPCETRDELEHKILKSFKGKLAKGNWNPPSKPSTEKKFTEGEVADFTQRMIMQFKGGNTNIEQLPLILESLKLYKP